LNQLTCSTIIADSTGIHEIDGGQKIVSVSWQEINKLELCKKCASERPILQVVLALICVVLGFLYGIIPLYLQISKFFYSGHVFNEFGLSSSPRRYFLVGGMIAFIPFGLYLLYLALRQRYCIRVSLDDDERTLFFQEHISSYEAEYFLSNISSTYGIKTIGIAQHGNET